MFIGLFMFEGHGYKLIKFVKNLHVFRASCRIKDLEKTIMRLSLFLLLYTLS